MARLSDITKGESRELDRILEANGFDGDLARNIIRNGDIAGIMVQAAREFLAPVNRVEPAEGHPYSDLPGGKQATPSKKAIQTSDFVHGLFTSAEEQMENIRACNKVLGWGIPDEAFAAAEKSVPTWPEKKLVAVVLVPYLADLLAGRHGIMDEDKTIKTGFERTFHELWMRAKAGQEASWCWGGYRKADSHSLRLHKGIKHEVGLHWEVIDLGCNRNKKPMDVRSSKSSPHAGILAAAALHPQWVKSMDGDKVPYVWIPGYKLQLPAAAPWLGVPILALAFDRGIRKIELDYNWCDSCKPGWAVPSFFRE